jgi:hypothetical protein
MIESMPTTRCMWWNESHTLTGGRHGFSFLGIGMGRCCPATLLRFHRTHRLDVATDCLGLGTEPWSRHSHLSGLSTKSILRNLGNPMARMKPVCRQIDSDLPCRLSIPKGFLQQKLVRLYLCGLCGERMLGTREDRQTNIAYILYVCPMRQDSI